MEIIKLELIDCKKTKFTSCDINEIRLYDEYFVHRSKGVRVSYNDDMGMDEEYPFDLEHTILKKHCTSVGFGYIRGEEVYRIDIFINGIEEEFITYTETFEEAKEISDKILNWLTTK
jgi:hypothetical protein